MSDNGKSNWKSRYALQTRIGSIVSMIGFVFLIAIPNYYVATTKIPAESELNYSKGKIILKQSKSRVGWIGLENKEKKTFFSCSKSYWGKRIMCSNKLGNSKDARLIEGKEAEIFWFEQPLFPLLVTRKRMAKIYVEGEEYLGYEWTSKMVDKGAKQAPTYASILFFFFVIGIYYFEKMAKIVKDSDS